MRTEEAVLITLSSLAEKIDPIDSPPEFILKDLIAQSEDTGHVQNFAEPMKRKNKVRKPRQETSEKEMSAESDSNVNGNGAEEEAEDDEMSRFD